MEKEISKKRLHAWRVQAGYHLLITSKTEITQELYLQRR